MEKQFSLVTSVHHYSVSPKMDQPIADGVLVDGCLRSRFATPFFRRWTPASRTPRGMLCVVLTMESFSYRESVYQSGHEECPFLLNADDADTFLSLLSHKGPSLWRVSVEREESLCEGSSEGESEAEEREGCFSSRESYGFRTGYTQRPHKRRRSVRQGSFRGRRDFRRIASPS